MTRKGPFSTAEVARSAGVHKDTLLRWLRAGLVPEPARDRHGWRTFSLAEMDRVVCLAAAPDRAVAPDEVAEEVSPALHGLGSIDWDFRDAKTSYLTHGLHPYPAKFIPQIPNALIQELSTVGATVGDIFCGSGTTLVEALILKRHAIGIDANPLACLITRAKTTPLSEHDAASLLQLFERARRQGDLVASTGRGTLFAARPFRSRAWRPEDPRLRFWFPESAIEEIAECLAWCKELESAAARDIALASLSSIIVAVSYQDSDTRYVRREKNLAEGDVFRRFSRALESARRAAVEFSEIVEPRFRCEVHNCSVLEAPSVPSLDLIVCSPPYPNAYSYHLYHRTRMLWLQMDQESFRQQEIGSHRKYSSSSPSRATPLTFQSEFRTILEWVARVLKTRAYACFVVGDSTYRGERIDNCDLIAAAARGLGLHEVMRLRRNLQASRKAFNPAIGRIREESILIFQNHGVQL